METKNGKFKIILGIILGIVIGVAITYILVHNNDSKNEKNELPLTLQEYKKSQEYKENIIIEAFKDYYTSKGFVMISDVKSWDITIKEEKEEYVILENKYTCNDNSGSCIYVPQEIEKDGNYIFTIRANGKYENYKYNITSITSTDTTSSATNPEEQTPAESVPNPVNTELDCETYSKLLQEYLTNKGLIFVPNLSSFKAESFEYKGYYPEKPDEKLYEVKISYSCLDGNSDCVYQPQSEDDINGIYNFSMIITITDGKIVNINGNILSQELVK
ncbi:MAG: hypothetical protein ACI4XM_04275 [Candidatus Coprovivens sp.]